MTLPRPKFFIRKSIFVPTLWTWASFLALLCLCLVLSVKYTYSFLAVNQPVKATVMVVEGWLPDHALIMSAERFNADQYHLLITTGSPLSTGSHLSKYKNYASLAKASLVDMGVTENLIKPFPTPKIMKDRTYTSARILSEWLSQHSTNIQAINIMTLGPHARRTLYLFEKAFPENIDIGIIAIPPEDYAPEQWWHSSEGIKTVLIEGIAYVYYRFFWFEH